MTRRHTALPFVAFLAALALLWQGCASQPEAETEPEQEPEPAVPHEEEEAEEEEPHEEGEAPEATDDPEPAEPDERAARNDEPQITEGNPRVRMVTSHGEIVLELWEDRYPNSVANFITLAGDGFYDGTKLHRIIDGFMFQGGDPNTRPGLDPATAGTGGPGYAIPDEHDEETVFDREGLIAYANAGPNTSGSQFFIMLGAARTLDGDYNLFGEVVEGMDVVERIGSVPVTAHPRTEEPSWPEEVVEVESVEVLAKRDHDYDVTKVD